MENSPPKGNWVPKLWSRCTFEFPILAEKSVSISVKTFFFFYLETTSEYPTSAEKSVSIAAKTFSFFFLWRPPVFGQKKPLNIRLRPKNQSQCRWRPFFFFFIGVHLISAWKNVWISELSEKFHQTVWNWFQNNENSGQGRLHFSHSFKKAPPFPNPGYASGSNYPLCHS